MGLIFGLYFGRYRRLWPIVVGHAVLDFLALEGVANAPTTEPVISPSHATPD
jgi:membrane protease YdiL (CAAX protease family)